jgi:hypothetical protein
VALKNIDIKNKIEAAGRHGSPKLLLLGRDLGTMNNKLVPQSTEAIFITIATKIIHTYNKNHVMR